MEAVRETLHILSLVILGLTALVAVVSAAKPDLFRSVFKEFARRRYIFSTAAFVGLLCGTLFFATEPSPNYSHELQQQKQQLDEIVALEDPETSQVEAESAPKTEQPAEQNSNNSTGSSSGQSSSSTQPSSGTTGSDPTAQSTQKPASERQSQSAQTQTPQTPAPNPSTNQNSSDSCDGLLSSLGCFVDGLLGG